MSGDDYWRNIQNHKSYIQLANNFTHLRKPQTVSILVYNFLIFNN